MHVYSSLPEGYREILSIDLKNNKKLMLFINALALLIGIIMVIPGQHHVSISALFDLSAGFGPYALRFLTLIVGLFAYIVLHELVHGISMKLCGTRKVKYGFTGAYAFAGSEDYYPKKEYIFIALAPVVLWGVVLAALNFVVPEEWFWIIYIVQIMNISGAAGDFFVTLKFLRFPDDILVKDYGVSMVVYSKHK